MLEIDSIRDDSAGARSGLRAGDRIARLNGEPVRDLLDFHFLLAGDDEEGIELEVVRGTAAQMIAVEREGGDPSDLGLSFAPLRTRLCGNECVFCFIDQNPVGLRKALYVKDEDYRLSFLHGNFVTLTNMKEWEIRRIVEQRLSPIYVSVHSTTPETRRRLLRSRKERDIMPILDLFRDHSIDMHTQIVLCPGYNDGEDLDRTVRDLAGYHPAVCSLAIVPLGMTDHRQGRVELEAVTPELAKRTLAQVERFQRDFRQRWGIDFVYMADEWYRILGRPVPPETRYDGYPQIENGIGMTRQFLNRLARQRRLFPDADHAGMRRATFVTAAHFRDTLAAAVGRALERTRESIELEFVGVHNDFFGRRVTVSGLLVGRDILRALEGRELGDRVFLPPGILNDDDLFLDDTSLKEFEARAGVPVQIGLRDRNW